MGGLGKTQLAVEFAYRYGKYFQGVHWLHLADPTTLDSEIALCGSQMGFANWPADQPLQVTMTQLEWKRNGPRLLILDNFEDVAQSRAILSMLHHSNLRLLVTSRRSDWPIATGLSSLPLDLFTQVESLTFFHQSLRNRNDKEGDLITLAERLGKLPLGLELASRYLNDHPRLSIGKYLVHAVQAFEHASMKGWRNDLPAPTGHDLDLQRTFVLSWQSVKEEIAQKIFMMAGYLAPSTPIPPEIFERALEVSSEVCDEVLSTLYGLGLLQQSENAQATIHPLMAEYARYLDSRKFNLSVLIDGLVEIANELNALVDQKGDYSLYMPILSHVRNVAEIGELAQIENTGILWNSLGYHISYLADYFGARTAYERALKIDEAAFGSDHPNVVIGVNNLGKVLQALGDLSGARTAYERALKIDEAAFGSDHPNVAIDVDNLGSVLQALGDLSGARTAHERALKIDEAAFGPDHPNVARDVNNLGSVLKALGDLSGARTAYERALKIFRKFLPSDHPKIRIVQDNLDSIQV